MPFLFLLFSALSGQAPWWRVQTRGLDTNLRGVSVVRVSKSKGVSALVVWASGSNGVILRSGDEGQTWNRLRVAGGDALDFRGIVAFNARTAYVLSSGEGEKSRIYKTTDGGETWNLQYTDKRKEFFLDSLACFSETQCWALGDPLDGKFLLLQTNEGEHWNPLPGGNRPAALPNEGAFAASNSCLLLSGEEIFFGTGGPVARVFHSRDAGRTWTVSETPMAHAKASSGIFSIARAGKKEIVVVGGDYQDPRRASGVAAYSLDEGQTWQLSGQQPGGYRSAVACDGDSRCVAVGPNGEDVSVGKVAAAIWKPADSLSLNALAISDGKDGWAVGPQGTIARYSNPAGFHRSAPSAPPPPVSPIAR